MCCIAFPTVPLSPTACVSIGRNSVLVEIGSTLLLTVLSTVLMVVVVTVRVTSVVLVMTMGLGDGVMMGGTAASSINIDSNGTVWWT